MKYFILCLIFTITISCGDSNDKKENSVSELLFSQKLDTSYKRNSTEMDYVKRTFFELKKNGIILVGSTDIGQNVVRITLDEVKKEGVLVSSKYGFLRFTSQEFDDFLNRMDTIFENPTKKLTYNFDNSSSIRYSDNRILIYFPLYDKGFENIYLNRNEVDSIKNFYAKCLSEINQFSNE